jgi:hypothetical protein
MLTLDTRTSPQEIRTALAYIAATLATLRAQGRDTEKVMAYADRLLEEL